MTEEKLREILDNCSFDIGGCGVGVDISKAISQIKALIEKEILDRTSKK